MCPHSFHGSCLHLRHHLLSCRLVFQYNAATHLAKRRDPVLRLHLRSKEAEQGQGAVAADGHRVRMDDEERTVMHEWLAEGVSKGTSETAEALHTALDLHAIHHFTHAAAVDGSVREQQINGRRLKRRVAYGVWEGMTLTCEWCPGLSRASSV